jgi:hypothetical protein
MSAPAIFVCTDQGAYCSYDYLTGINKHPLVEKDITVYPNPVKEKLYISTGQTCRKIQIMTLSSEEVHTLIPESNRVILDVSNLKAGVYIMRCQFTDGTVSRKFVVQ